MVNMKKIALFAAGTLFGSAGFKLLSSSDAKKVYTQTAAAVLRMKDSTMETVNRPVTFWQTQRLSTRPALPRLRPLSSRTLLRRLPPPRLPNNPRPYGSRLRAALFHGQKGNEYEMHHFA